MAPLPLYALDDAQVQPAARLGFETTPAAAAAKAGVTASVWTAGGVAEDEALWSLGLYTLVGEKARVVEAA